MKCGSNTCTPTQATAITTTERNETEWEIPTVEGVLEEDGNKSEANLDKKSDDKGDVVFHDPVTDEVRLEHPRRQPKAKESTPSEPQPGPVWR